MYKLAQISTLLQKTIALNVKRKICFLPKEYSCLCGQVYLKKQGHNHRYEISRIYSTQSDQHRQKVVIETQTPKIVYDKLGGKVLPDRDEIEAKAGFWKEKIDPYIKLARWDRPIGMYFLFFLNKRFMFCKCMSTLQLICIV